MSLSLFEHYPTLPPHILSFNEEEWAHWLKKRGYPVFTSHQILNWIYQKGALNPDLFSNIPKLVREDLKKSFDFRFLTIKERLLSKDGSEKLLLLTHDELMIEMVVMPYENRLTLCLSSQVGCKMGCTFCQTGKMGLTRNLSSAEILGQIALANHLFAPRKISNVVFMGMGEPLDNYDEVVKACKMMIDEKGFALSKAKVTISTSGLVPALKKLSHDLPVRLAISLHSADNEKRSRMMPINRKYDLATLKEVLLTYPAPSRYGITFEYVMIENENDSIEDAKKLVKFIHGMKAKVNLIPINHFPGIEMHPSKESNLRAFQTYLSDRSIPAPIRYSRGQDVSGGCGQLAAKAKEELNIDPRLLQKKRRQLNWNIS